MSNNLGIPERTLAQVLESTNSLHVIGGVGGRLSVYEPLVVRITDHDDDTSAEEDDATLMALFVSQRHGEPFTKDAGVLEHIIYQQGVATGATATAVLSGATVGAVTVTAGGTGYQNPVVTAINASSSNATFKVVVTKGVITSITTLTGSGYVGDVTIFITETAPKNASVLFPNFDYSTFE